MEGYWQRAWYGRVLHYFIGADRTACGKTLTPHKEYWQKIAVPAWPYCKGCVGVLTLEKAKQAEELQR